MNALSGVEMTKSVPLLLIWCYAALIVIIQRRCMLHVLSSLLLKW
jgi:hypothetical protein